MLHAADKPRPRVTDDQHLPEPNLSAQDAAALLAVDVGGAWDVEHAVDPSGYVSIIVAPTRDDEVLPTFVLYQEFGVVRVATIRRDIWESDQAFPSGYRASAAIKAATAALAVAA